MASKKQRAITEPQQKLLLEIGHLSLESYQRSYSYTRGLRSKGFWGNLINPIDLYTPGIAHIGNNLDNLKDLKLSTIKGKTLSGGAIEIAIYEEYLFPIMLSSGLIMQAFPNKMGHYRFVPQLVKESKPHFEKRVQGLQDLYKEIPTNVNLMADNFLEFAADFRISGLQYYHLEHYQNLKKNYQSVFPAKKLNFKTLDNYLKQHDLLAEMSPNHSHAIPTTFLKFPNESIPRFKKRVAKQWKMIERSELEQAQQTAQREAFSREVKRVIGANQPPSKEDWSKLIKLITPSAQGFQEKEELIKFLQYDFSFQPFFNPYIIDNAIPKELEAMKQAGECVFKSNSLDKKTYVLFKDMNETDKEFQTRIKTQLRALKKIHFDDLVERLTRQANEKNPENKVNAKVVRQNLKGLAENDEALYL